MKQNKLNFRALPGLASCHLQTIVATYLPGGTEPPAKEWLIDLGHDDFLSCQISIPSGWQHTGTTVILVHGLGGSHASGYVVRMARKLYNRGCKVVRVNLRNCGSGKGLSKLLYHGGTSKDLLKVVQHVKESEPLSPISIIGYSLGGNITLKLAGELGVEATNLVHKFIAVCAPYDLVETVANLLEDRNRIYHSYYHKNICEQAREFNSRKTKNLYEFDEIVTAPPWGYLNAAEYYEDCSSIRWLNRIHQPTHLLFAKDDPFVSLDKLYDLLLPDVVHLWTSEKGGHLGFLGKGSNTRGIYWMDEILSNWIEDDFTSNLLTPSGS